MKECPNCKELVGDNAKSCFNCRYSFITKCVKSLEEVQKNRDFEREKMEKQNETAQLNHDLLYIKNMITTGYDFQGYDIVEHLGVVSGTSVITIYVGSDRCHINEVPARLLAIKEEAFNAMKSNCYKSGGNAIIGVQTNTIQIAPGVVGLIAIGTAVKINPK